MESCNYGMTTVASLGDMRSRCVMMARGWGGIKENNVRNGKIKNWEDKWCMIYLLVYWHLCNLLKECGGEEDYGASSHSLYQKERNGCKLLTSPYLYSEDKSIVVWYHLLKTEMDSGQKCSRQAMTQKHWSAKAYLSERLWL